MGIFLKNKIKLLVRDDNCFSFEFLSSIRVKFWVRLFSSSLFFAFFVLFVLFVLFFLIFMFVFCVLCFSIY